MRFALLFCGVSLALSAADPVPPVAKAVPKELKLFGDTRVDNYFWMRERENPDVLAYVTAENAYTEAVFQPIKPLVDKVYKEMLGRIKQTDLSAPYRHGPYFYYSRTVEGQQYPIRCRKKGGLEAAEEVMFDANEMARGKKFFSLGAVIPDPAHRLYLFSTDETGYREYDLRIKDMTTGRILPDRIERVGGGAAWSSDSRFFFYTKQQPKTKRSYQVWLHEVGTPVERDRMIYEEKDEKFRVGVGRSRSGRFIMMGSASGRTSEMRYVDAATPQQPFTVLLPRQEGITYGVQHHSDAFYIRINDTGRDFRVVRAPIAAPGDKSRWKEAVPARAGLYVQDMVLLRNYAIYLLRLNGLHQIRVDDLAKGGTHNVAFEESSYTLGFDANPEFDTATLRFDYGSMVTPQTVYDYDLVKRARTLVKRQEVLGGYDPSQYAVERVSVTSHDGVKVPMTIAYRKGVVRNGTAPALLYGYGAYAIPTDPRFSSGRLSLLDRGFVYALAHIRGGTDLGYSWYEDGKLLKKKNSFKDFIACAEFLRAQKYADPKRLSIEGGSAGGLLVGAAAIQRPELFRTVIAAVPLVDVVNSLLDEAIPLTTTDADEFGSPKIQQFYEYQKSYSPYDNTGPAKYPNLYIFSSMNDSQVPYWEPLKWTARLRTANKGGGLVVLRMNVAAGHGGASGRYDRLREVAQSYAFLLHTSGVRE